MRSSTLARPNFKQTVEPAFLDPTSMDKTKSVLSILKAFGQDLLWDETIDPEVRQELEAIQACRDGSYGSTHYHCPNCQGAKFVAAPCKNRHCPACSWQRQMAWLDNVLSWKLACPYFHVVFTAPHELNPLIQANRHRMYDLFFRTSLSTVRQVAENDYGCTPAILQALHTWGQRMKQHVHIHMIVSAGGLAYRTHEMPSKNRPAKSNTTKAAEYRWVEIPRDASAMQAQHLADLFQKKFLRRLRHLYKKGLLILPEEMKDIDSLEAFTKWLEPHAKRPWKTDVQITPEHLQDGHPLMLYLSNYIAGTAISDHRIVSVDSKKVTISYWCYRTSRYLTETMEGEEFVRRYLLHIVPTQCRRLRSHGLFRGQLRKVHLHRCHRLIRAWWKGQEPVERGHAILLEDGLSGSQANHLNDHDHSMEDRLPDRKILPPGCCKCGWAAMEKTEHWDARQTKEWLGRIRHVIALYQKRFTTLDAMIDGLQRRKRTEKLADDTRPIAKASGTSQKTSTTTGQLSFEDWRFAKAWSMVFTSFVIGLSHEVMIGSMSLEHRMNGFESSGGSDLPSCNLCSAEKELSSSKGLRVDYTLPLPNW